MFTQLVWGRSGPLNSIARILAMSQAAAAAACQGDHDKSIWRAERAVARGHRRLINTFATPSANQVRPLSMLRLAQEGQVKRAKTVLNRRPQYSVQVEP